MNKAEQRSRINCSKRSYQHERTSYFVKRKSRLKYSIHRIRKRFFSPSSCSAASLRRFSSHLTFLRLTSLCVARMRRLQSIVVILTAKTKYGPTLYSISVSIVTPRRFSLGFSRLYKSFESWTAIRLGCVDNNNRAN
jgi:hypothetical protein